MKKVYILFFIVILAFFIISSPAFAGAGNRIEVNKDGEVRLWQDTEEWRPLTEEEERAYKNPGVEVPINIRFTTIERIRFFYYIPISEYSEMVVFNGKLNTINKEGLIYDYGKKRFAVWVVFLLIAILSMIAANIVRYKDYNSNFAVAFAVLATLAFVSVLVAFTTENKILYTTSVIIFYIHMIAGMIIV
jgi:hypothetical protein